MNLNFKKTTTLKQLLIALLPIILTLVLVLLYTQYTRNLTDIKKREHQKLVNVKTGVRLFIDNYDLSLALIELQLADRITYLINQILSNHSKNLINMDLNVLKEILGMDENLEDIYIINPKGIITNATKSHDIGIDFNSFGISYRNLLDKIHQKKKLVIERIATEAKTKVKKKYGYIVLPNHYILEIGVEDPKINTLTDYFSRKLNNFENEYSSIESIDLFGATEYFPPKNKDGKIALSHKQIAINCYLNKRDTILPISNDKNINFLYLPIRNSSVYQGYVLQIITNNNLINALTNATKKRTFFTILSILLLLSFIIYYFSKKITTPIHKLAAKIKKNNEASLLEPITINGNYEINYLTQEFNKHIKNTKEQHLILEEKITARTRLLRLKNNELEKISNERALLLEEIHHRVKNNLQIVSSLLNFQIRDTSSPEAISALKNSRSRIKTISLVHEKLYMNSNFITTNAADYLQDLTQVITQNISDNINIKVYPSTVLLRNTQATAVGLIVHEFILNSTKHAFENMNNPEVSIHIETQKTNIIMKLCNNGKLLDDSFNITESTSMGNKITHGFVQVLKGDFTFKNQPNNKGVVMTVTFPITE